MPHPNDLLLKILLNPKETVTIFAKNVGMKIASRPTTKPFKLSAFTLITCYPIS